MSDFPPLKNSSHTVCFPIFDSSGAPLAGATVSSSKVRKDSGSLAATTNSVVEIAEGLYDLTLTATEMNADRVVVKVLSDGKPVVIVLHTVVRQLKDLAFPSVSGDSVKKEIADNMLVEGSLSFIQGQRLQVAQVAGKTSGAGTPNFKIRDYADTKDRIDADVDDDGNRTDVTRDVT